MKRYLCAIAVLLFILGNGSIVNAQTQRLVVWMKSGEKVLYDLGERPTTTFADEELTITTNSVRDCYPLSQVLRYTYELSPSGIESINKNEVRISQKGNDLIFEHLTSDAIIRVYSLDGVLIDTKKSVGDKQTTVSLKDYSVGVYLVKVGNITYKLMKQ